VLRSLSPASLCSVAATPDEDAAAFLRSKAATMPLPKPDMAAVRAEAADTGAGLSVLLNIYDVTHASGVQWMNAVLANWLAPVKLGGVFHAGVEVQGLEWSYGRTCRARYGISCGLPRSDPQHHFRQTVYLGRTQHSREKISSLITDLLEDYPGHAYDLLRRNCCHFADDFCGRLGVGPIPRWVHRLARLGAGADGVMQAVLGTSAIYLVDGVSNGPGILANDEQWDSDYEPDCLSTAEPMPMAAVNLEGDLGIGALGPL